MAEARERAMTLSFAQDLSLWLTAAEIKTKKREHGNIVRGFQLAPLRYPISGGQRAG